MFVGFSQSEDWVDCVHKYRTFDSNNDAIEVRHDRIKDGETYTSFLSKIERNEKGHEVKRTNHRYNKNVQKLAPFSIRAIDRINKTHVIQKWNEQTQSFQNFKKRINIPRTGFEIEMWEAPKNQWVKNKRVTNNHKGKHSRYSELWLEPIQKWVPLASITRGGGEGERIRYDEDGDENHRVNWESDLSKSERITHINHDHAEKGEWENHRKVLKEVVGNDKIVTHQRWDEETQTFLNKRKITITKEGRKVQRRLYQKWDKEKEEWKNSLKFDYTYTDFNKISYTLVQRWKGTTEEEALSIEEELPIADVQEESIECIYPNPFNNNSAFQVNNINTERDCTLTLVDGTGKVLVQRPLRHNQERIQIENKMANGLHVVLITAQDELLYQGKLVVVNQE